MESLWRGSLVRTTTAFGRWFGQYFSQRFCFPPFSKIQDDIPRLRDAFKRALCVSVFTIVFPAYLICVLSYPFIELVLTPKWLPCIPYWWLLTCTVVLYPIHVLNLQILNARGRSDLFLWLEILKKCLAVVSIGILYFCGLIPMLIFMIFSSCISAYLNSYNVGKEIEFNLWKQLKSVYLYALLAAASCFVAWGAYRSIYPCSHWTGLIVPAIIGTVCCLLLNHYFRTPAFIDLVGLLGDKFPGVKRIFRLSQPGK
ncbi:MAG: oligosaccharide flippase family protein [Planctomycetia bacterium]|nr:oligosaccharide flippase family protein [Planctomycetia bacterium]